MKSVIHSDDSWIQTFSGRKVYPMFMRASDIRVEDIAAHLSCEARFSGACRDAHGRSVLYSVAQHSVLASLYCEPVNALWGLLHDASEAYLRDVPRPLKRHPDFAFYRSAEEQCMRAICEAYGLTYAMPVSVKTADERLLATEARDLMSPVHPEWRVMATPYVRRIWAWSPESARQAFLTRFRIITTDPEQAWRDSEAYACQEVK